MSVAQGFVTLNDDIVGTFELDEHEKITLTSNKKTNSVLDLLEFAAQEGMSLGLMIQSDFDGYVPKHHEDDVGPDAYNSAGED